MAASSKQAVPYGKPREILKVLKLIFLLICGCGNGVLHGILWLLQKKRRVLGLRLYMFAAASRTLLAHMHPADIQASVGLNRMEVDLNKVFYYKLRGKNSFNEPLKGAQDTRWIYQVENRTPQDPVIYYIHGGGYNLTVTPNQIFWADGLAKKLAHHRVSVVALNYSVAPYATCPTQLSESVHDFKALAQSCDRIIFMGDSAGGHLCITTLLETAGTPVHKKAFGCVLISPWVELLPNRLASPTRNSHSDWVPQDFGITCAQAFTGLEVNPETEKLVGVPSNKYDIALATSSDLKAALPRNTVEVWSANELLTDCDAEFAKKAGITDTFAENGVVHDITYFGHNNQSTRHILNSIQNWCDQYASSKIA